MLNDSTVDCLPTILNYMKYKILRRIYASPGIRCAAREYAIAIFPVVSPTFWREAGAKREKEKAMGETESEENNCERPTDGGGIMELRSFTTFLAPSFFQLLPSRRPFATTRVTLSSDVLTRFAEEWSWSSSVQTRRKGDTVFDRGLTGDLGCVRRHPLMEPDKITSDILQLRIK